MFLEQKWLALTWLPCRDHRPKGVFLKNDMMVRVVGSAGWVLQYESGNLVGLSKLSIPLVRKNFRHQAPIVSVPARYCMYVRTAS